MKHLAIAHSAAAVLAANQHLGPLETRDENDDQLAAATAAVEELRTATAEHQTRADATIAELRQQITGLETRMNRPNGGNQTEEPTLERRAFTNFLRFGQDRMPADEVRALVVGDDTKGGYLAPGEFQAEVIRGVIDLSPIRQAVRVTSISAGSLILPKLVGRPTAAWVGEDEDRQETNMTYGQVEIPVHELACYIDVSLRLLEDSAINIESEISTELSQEFAGKESAAFSNGDGAKKPQGIQRAAGITEISNGSTTAINPDKLFEMVMGLSQAYRARGAWLMNSVTIGKIRTLKDAGNNYLWQNFAQVGGLTEPQPDRLLGYPIIEDPTMPDPVANSFPIMFGDFNRAYRIVDRVGLSVLRDPYTQATKGLVRFHARRRVGGGPILTEALRKLKMA